MCVATTVPRSRMRAGGLRCSDDMFAQDSIELLQKSGIDFQRHAQYGIDIAHFGELLISSGMVLSDAVKWIAFHGCASRFVRRRAGAALTGTDQPRAAVGCTSRTYDFGYLLKVVTCDALPDDEAQFHELLHLYFPCIYDIKYLMKSCKSLRGGLQDVADTLAVRAGRHAPVG
jgi:CCR4-NOT transcription complex subunit 7/8